MKTINLKKYYYPLYETDTFIELPDEIADAIAEEWRTDHNSEQRLWSHTYSMDYSPGLEYHLLSHALSAEDTLLEEETRREQEEAHELMLQRLREALATLTPTQARRLHARFVEGKKYREIAEDEGIASVSLVTNTVRDAILKLREIFYQTRLDGAAEGGRDMHKEITTQAKQKKDEREEVLKEIRQLENRQKILENKQRNEERKARTRRLIERGAILEGVFPLAPDLPGVEVKAFPDCPVPSSGGGGTGRKTAEIRGQAVSPLVYKGALIHRCRCRAPCRGPLRTSSAMGSYTPQTPCAPRAAKHPLRVCSAPRSLKYPRRKEVPPIDFCHIPVSIIKRSEGRSAVAAAAYRSGTKLTNEWDGLTHDYTRKGGVVHAEIMLPAHAPPEFSDTLHPLEQRGADRESQGQPACPRGSRRPLPRELSREQQLALVRAYVKDNFVDKGMCADFAIHDKGTGNPHVHIMLTVRPLKENGAWGAKCRKAYDLDENGQRIPNGRGGWKTTERIPPTGTTKGMWRFGGRHGRPIPTGHWRPPVSLHW